MRQSKGDADTLIAKTTKSCAEDGSVAVVTKETNVLVILLHQWNPGSGDIFRCERQETNKKKLKQHTRRRTRQLRLVFEERNQSCGGASKELQSPGG